MPKKESKKRTGPKPETLKLRGDWKDLIGKALKKKRPKEGWPELAKKGKRKGR